MKTKNMFPANKKRWPDTIFSFSFYFVDPHLTNVWYDFDDEAFTDISDEAKDFISKLLIKEKE